MKTTNEIRYQATAHKVYSIFDHFAGGELRAFVTASEAERRARMPEFVRTARGMLLKNLFHVPGYLWQTILFGR